MRIFTRISNLNQRRDYGPTGAADLLRDYGPDGAADAAAESAWAAGPSKDYGPDGAADGPSRSTSWHADDRTMQPFESGPRDYGQDRAADAAAESAVDAGP